MEKNILVIFLGVVFVAMGIALSKGHIELMHSYHIKRITEETRIPYGRTVGLGTGLIGIGMLTDGIISFFKESFILTIVCLVAGIGVIIYGQFKYNKGIF
ncbi:MAG: hypothetical protein E7533_05765 [Ruminococcaceae bacterium]|nr:hypothetical protein [Oscillospiraceae bacterium]